MGEAEIDLNGQRITISSHVITYGNAADEKLTEYMRSEIEIMWNEPKGMISIKGIPFNPDCS